ncbi:MAG: hypothetical protein ACKO6E_13180, partial [Planctomycetota bacterium]
MSKVVSSIGEKAKVRVDVKKTASAHDLRRAFGERWAARLMPAQLMELMRHESIDTTLSYYVGGINLAAQRSPKARRRSCADAVFFTSTR